MEEAKLLAEQKQREYEEFLRLKAIRDQKVKEEEEAVSLYAHECEWRVCGISSYIWVFMYAYTYLYTFIIFTFVRDKRVFDFTVGSLHEANILTG